MLMLLFCMWTYSDDSDSFKTTKQIFDELEIENVTEQDCRLVRHVCGLVSRRAAFLASAGALKIVGDAAVLGLGLGCHSSWLEKQRLCCGYCTEKWKFSGGVICMLLLGFLFVLGQNVEDKKTTQKPSN